MDIIKAFKRCLPEQCQGQGWHLEPDVLPGWENSFLSYLAFSKPRNTHNAECIQLIHSWTESSHTSVEQNQAQLAAPWVAATKLGVHSLSWHSKSGVQRDIHTLHACRFTVCTACVSAGTLGDVIQHFRDELNHQKVIWSGKKYWFDCEWGDKECTVWTGRQFTAVGECVHVSTCSGCKYRDIPAFMCHLFPFVWTSLLRV